MAASCVQFTWSATVARVMTLATVTSNDNNPNIIQKLSEDKELNQGHKYKLKLKNKNKISALQMFAGNYRDSAGRFLQYLQGKPCNIYRIAGIAGKICI